MIFIKFILTNVEKNQLIKTGGTLSAIVPSLRYVRKNIHIHTYTNVHTYIHTYIHTHIHTLYIHVHTHTYLHTYIHTYIYM